MACFRSRPEDFDVEEELLYPATGTGPYTLIRIEKTCRTTTEVARLLCRALDRRPRDVGFAGRKDRFAVARQWFSLPDIEPARARRVEIEGVRVLEAVRHRERLRLGELLENRFRLVVRQVEPEDHLGLDARLRTLRARGFANRFGGQRFGRDGDNALRAMTLLEGGARAKSGRRPDRRTMRFLISALQSAVFNDLIEKRDQLTGDLGGDLERRAIDVLFAGDLAIEHRTGRLVPIDDPASFQDQADAVELSPTGLLFGERVRAAGGRIGELETKVLESWRVPAPSQWRMPFAIAGDRRALRVRPRALEIERVEDAIGSHVIVRLALPAGAYATVLLAELFPGIVEG